MTHTNGYSALGALYATCPPPPPSSRLIRENSTPKRVDTFFSIAFGMRPYLDNVVNNRLNRPQNKANCADNIGILANNLTQFCQI